MDLNLLLAISLSMALGILMGYKAHQRLYGQSAPPAAPEPRVTVVVPADYKALEPIMLDGKPAIVGPRALLWYAAYAKAIAAFSCDGSYAVSEDDEYNACKTAEAAVQHVYGDTHDS